MRASGQPNNGKSMPPSSPPGFGVSRVFRGVKASDAARKSGRQGCFLLSTLPAADCGTSLGAQNLQIGGLRMKPSYGIKPKWQGMPA